MTGQGRYELLDRIGKGGMAELFRARTIGAEGFSKVVALKRILPELAGDEAFAAMLIDEARVVANLSHPNIVQVFELGRDSTGYYIAMELVNGPNLSAILTRLREQGRRLPEPLALEIVILVLQALDSAHRYTDAAGRALGIVHRDVSPQNILISDAGAVKLGDFGIAKAKNRVTRETQTGGIKGKIPYMAPEQVRGTGVDGRTDQFACALVLWECLAGQMHYAGESDMELLWKAGEARIRPLAEVGVEVSPELEALLARALQTRPEDRYDSCGDFARALMAYDRRTYPGHDPAALAKLVAELFGAELQELAERLRRVMAGEEPSAGWAGGGVAPIPLVRAVVPASAAPAGGMADHHFDEPLEPTVVRSRVLASASPAPEAPEPPSLAEPEAPDAEEPEEEQPEAPPRMTAEELRAIDAALEAEREQTSPGDAAPKRRGVSVPMLLGAFALAAGGAWFGLGALDRPTGLAPLEPPAATSAEPAPEPAETVAEPIEPAPDARVPAPAPTRSAPARKTDRHEARGGFATLDVTCTPECSIEIDGRDTGLVAPVKGIVVTAGKRRLRVYSPTLKFSKTVTLDVTAGQHLVRDFNLVLKP